MRPLFSRKLFPSQQEDETILLVVHEHWFRLFLKFLLWLFFALALVAFNHYGNINAPGLFTGSAGLVTLLFSQVYELFLALSLFIIFILYYLNIQVITNIRVVEITQEGLFSHTISELHIDKIEDATSETVGVFGTLFNYGNVYVQTAGTKERFQFTNVPRPAQIEKLVLDLYERNSNFVKGS
jgi:hypothetical protein